MKIFQTIIKSPLECIAGTAFFVMTSVIFIQVICRYIFNYPLVWPEELARLLFVWTSFLGAAIGLKLGSHYKVEFFIDFLPRQGKDILMVLFDYLLLFLVSYWGWQGIKALEGAAKQSFAALRISMVWLYLPIPVCCGLMFIFIVMRLPRDLKLLYHK